MIIIKLLAYSITLILMALPAPAQETLDPVGEARRLNNFGVEAAANDLWSEAAFRWLQAIDVYPGLPSAHNNLAVVYEHFGKYDLAKMHYQIAMERSNSNRFIESNNRMFLQFFHQHVVQKDTRKMRDQNSEETGPKTVSTGEGEDDPSVEQNTEGVGIDDAGEIDIPEGDYHKVGGPRQVLIKHPKRETAMSGKYRRVYIAGFAPVQEDAENLNFETTEFLRSELRKYTAYDVIPLEELSLPSDEDEFFDLIDDTEFWRNLGIKVGADLIITGRVDFYNEMSDGIYPYEYRDRYTGEYRTAQLMVPRTAFTVELELYFHNTSSGDVVHEESFGQTIVYRGRLDLTLQAFFDVMNRIIPRFMDILVPREHDAIRFLVKG